MNAKWMLSLAVATLISGAARAEVPTGADLMKVCGSNGTNPLIEVVMRRWGGQYVYLDIEARQPNSVASIRERKIGWVYENTEDSMKIAIGHVENGKFKAEPGQAMNLEIVNQGVTVRGQIAYKAYRDEVQCFINFE